jgi:hypothetical protein
MGGARARTTAIAIAATIRAVAASIEARDRIAYSKVFETMRF